MRLTLRKSCLPIIRWRKLPRRFRLSQRFGNPERNCNAELCRERSIFLVYDAPISVFSINLKISANCRCICSMCLFIPPKPLNMPSLPGTLQGIVLSASSSMLKSTAGLGAGPDLRVGFATLKGGDSGSPSSSPSSRVSNVPTSPTSTLFSPRKSASDFLGTACGGGASFTLATAPGAQSGDFLLASSPSSRFCSTFKARS